MASFSERHGYREVRTALQQEEMDELLRTDLWNAMSMFTEKLNYYTKGYAPYLQVWINLWRKPIDNLPYEISAMNKVVKKHILEDSDADAIEQALRDAADLTGAKRHLKQALGHLADRQAPDYENSIKESIGAVKAEWRP